MKNCVNCGAELDDSVKFCTVCGAPADGAAAPAPVAEPYVAPVQPIQVAAAPKGPQIVALIFGICALVFCWLGIVGGIFGIFPIAFGIVALVVGGKAKNAGAGGMAKTGWVLGLIGLILAAILTIVGIALVGFVASYY